MGHTRRMNAVRHLLGKTTWDLVREAVNRRTAGEPWRRREVIREVEFELDCVNMLSGYVGRRHTIEGYLNQLSTVGYIGYHPTKTGVYIRRARIPADLTTVGLRAAYEDPCQWLF